MERQENDDLAALLPEDILADVLRRVSTPRWLAVSRCVCKSWHAIVDGEGLLCTDLPFSGIFIQFKELPFPEFFSRPPSSGRPAISGNLDFLPPANKLHSHSDCYYVHDNCNGLLLISVDRFNPVTTRNAYVVNPATRRWDTLPARPPKHAAYIEDYYLAFDPRVSSYYQVFRIPYVCSTSEPGDQFDTLEEASEWPPSTYILHVFSSRTRRWERRSFVREGDAAGTVAKTRMYPAYNRLGSVLWRGSLYVQCQANFVMRISLCEDKYNMIKPPSATIEEFPYLGRSEKGVYLASIVAGNIRVFILNDVSVQAEWILKHDYNLDPVRAFGGQVYGPWILEDINYDSFHSSIPGVYKKEIDQETFEWNSDNGDFDENREVIEAHPRQYVDIEILGFHPYKEILFLCSSRTYKLDARAFAYHLNSFKVESLGSIYPTVHSYFDSGLANECRDVESFPYTPCFWIEQTQN
ncbi:hypothetical protein ACQ4PT_064500 [Festuca glaucescens]